MTPDPDAERFDATCAVIGAGAAGLATAKALQERGVSCHVLESAFDVGGMWQIDAPDSAAYPTLQCNSSRRMTQFSAFPMPRSWPDFPTYRHMAEYLEAFADEFALRPLIEFGAAVTRVEPVPGPGLPGYNGWAVTTADGRTRCYENVIVATGHHRQPHVPDLPGSFRGETMHSRDYRDPDVFLTRRVLIVGAGNSGTDIAVDCARRAEHTILASRRELQVLPRYLLGRPYDQLRPGVANLLPPGMERSLFDRFVRVSAPEVDGQEHSAPPVAPPVAPDLPPLVESGDVELKPAPTKLSGDRVNFADGTRSKVDLIVFATGYDVDLPFLDAQVLQPDGNRMPLYRKVVAPQRPGLWFVGFIDTIGATLPLFEEQAEWLGDVVTGEASLPGRTAMRKWIEADQRSVPPGHPLQVDLWRYNRTLKRERGRRSARPTWRQRLVTR